MTPFTIVWTTEAEDSLALLWVQAPHRNALVSAQFGADALLASNPFPFSRYLSEGLWAITVYPLILFFTVDESKRVVQIERVRLIVEPH